MEAKVVLWWCNKSVSVVRSQGRFASVCERHDDNAEKVGGDGVRGVGCAAAAAVLCRGGPPSHSAHFNANFDM